MFTATYPGQNLKKPKRNMASLSPFAWESPAPTPASPWAQQMRSDVGWDDLSNIHGEAARSIVGRPPYAFGSGFGTNKYNHPDIDPDQTAKLNASLVQMGRETAERGGILSSIGDMPMWEVERNLLASKLFDNKEIPLMVANENKRRIARQNAENMRFGPGGSVPGSGIPVSPQERAQSWVMQNAPWQPAMVAPSSGNRQIDPEIQRQTAEMAAYRQRMRWLDETGWNSGIAPQSMATGGTGAWKDWRRQMADYDRSLEESPGTMSYPGGWQGPTVSPEEAAKRIEMWNRQIPISNMVSEARKKRAARDAMRQLFVQARAMGGGVQPWQIAATNQMIQGQPLSEDLQYAMLGPAYAAKVQEAKAGVATAQDRAFYEAMRDATPEQARNLLAARKMLPYAPNNAEGLNLVPVEGKDGKEPTEMVANPKVVATDEEGELYGIAGDSRLFRKKLDASGNPIMVPTGKKRDKTTQPYQGVPTTATGTYNTDPRSSKERNNDRLLNKNRYMNLKL